jgi:hypothetical protein
MKAFGLSTLIDFAYLSCDDYLMVKFSFIESRADNVSKDVINFKQANFYAHVVCKMTSH